ncbi:hypothetical protein HZC34_08115 [Candidatus Saganbacteria bacterium]|nr:hypothetical protein [Candidatus Saganbacteria bacterium]
MRYDFKPSFVRCFKKLPPQKQDAASETIEKLKIFYETREIAIGLGLKNLKKDYWEIRASLKDRILFKLIGNAVYFVLVGNHDEIKKFLKNP